MVGFQVEIERRNHKVAGLRSRQEKTGNDRVQSRIRDPIRLVAATRGAMDAQMALFDPSRWTGLKMLIHERCTPRCQGFMGFG